MNIEILIFHYGNILQLGRLADLFDRFEIEFSKTYSFTTRYFGCNPDCHNTKRRLKNADYIFIYSKAASPRIRILDFLNKRTVSSKIILLYVPLREREILKSKYRELSIGFISGPPSIQKIAVSICL